MLSDDQRHDGSSALISATPHALARESQLSVHTWAAHISWLTSTRPTAADMHRAYTKIQYSLSENVADLLHQLVKMNNATCACTLLNVRRDRASTARDPSVYALYAKSFVHACVPSRMISCHSTQV